MCRRDLIPFILTFAALLTGCAAVPPYRANVTDEGQGSLLRAWSSGKDLPLIYTCTEKVDGLLLFDGLHVSDTAQFTRGSLVDAGIRTLSVMATFERGLFNYTGRAELQATLEPGHTYSLKATVAEEDRITLWLENDQTQETASERKTITTSRWIKFP